MLQQLNAGEKDSPLLRNNFWDILTTYIYAIWMAFKISSEKLL